MKTVELYYDFSCPFAYLASTQIERIGNAHDARIQPCPVLLGGIYRALKNPDNPAAEMSPAKAKHNLNDMVRWAAYYRVPFEMPASHPMRTVDALRLLLVAPAAAWWPLTHAMYRAYWVEGRQLADRGVLAEITEAAGLDGLALVARIDAPEIKQGLRDRTRAALDKGVFGVPTFFVEGELFWGQDRMIFVERVLRGEGFTYHT